MNFLYLCYDYGMCVIAIFINIFFISNIFAQDITQLVAVYKQGKAEILTLEENIKQYKLQLNQIDENINSLINNKRSVQKEISNLNNAINTKKRQISSINSNINNQKQQLSKGLSKLKENPDAYNSTKSQIAQISQSIKDIDKTDKQIRNLNTQLARANIKAQAIKQTNAVHDASSNGNIENIKSKLMSLKSSLGVN